MIRIPLPIRVVTKGRITLGPPPAQASQPEPPEEEPAPDTQRAIPPPLPPEAQPGNGVWQR